MFVVTGLNLFMRRYRFHLRSTLSQIFLLNILNKTRHKWVTRFKYKAIKWTIWVDIEISSEALGEMNVRHWRNIWETPKSPFTLHWISLLFVGDCSDATRSGSRRSCHLIDFGSFMIESLEDAALNKLFSSINNINISEIFWEAHT